MYSILERYIGKTIINNIFSVLCILISLSSIIKFIEQLRRVGQGNYSVLGAGLFTVLSIPKDIDFFFPVAALLGVLLGLGSLATHSELIIIQASGFSCLQVLISVIKVAIPLAFLTMIISEWVSPVSEQIAYNYRARMIYNNHIFSIESRIWAKDGNDFIFIEKVLSSNKLVGVNIYHFNHLQRLQLLRYAAVAMFKNGNWTLLKINEFDFTDKKQIIEKAILSDNWHTNLTPSKLGVVILKPNSLSISGLYKYICYLNQSGQESNRYQLYMWSKILSPFLMIIMMIIALLFILGPLYNVQIGMRVITGVSFSFLFYILDNLIKKFGIVYNVYPVFCAFFPGIILIIISIFFLLKR